MYRFKIILSLLFIFFLSVYVTPQAFPQNVPDEEEQVVEEEQADVNEEEPKEVEGQVQPPAAPAAEPAKQGLTGQQPQEVKQPVVEPQPPVPSEPAVQQAIPVEPEKQPAVAPPVPQPPIVPQPPAVPQQPKAVPTVSFFFDDADIYEVIQTIFADVLKVNYIVDPQVKGRVNFRTITPVPRDEVLPIMEIVMRMNGIGFVEEQGLYRIVPLTDVPQELVYSQIGKSPEKVAIDMFNFKNLDLKEAMPDIENALGLHLKGGTVRILPIFRLNSLIVVASSSEQLMYIRKWIEVFDEMFFVTRLKIFVYSLQNSKATHIASLMQSIFSGSAAAPTTTPRPVTPRTTTSRTTAQTTTTPSTELRTGAAATVTGGGKFVSPETKVFADEISNSLIILATPADYSFIEETIKKIDIQPRQVVIEALIARVDLIDNLSFGFSWALRTDVNISMRPFTRDINLNGSAFNNPGGLPSTDSPTSATGFTFVGSDPTGHIRALLRAALKDSRAKILAAPHILVSDNQQASIQVGSQIPLATSTTSYVTSATGTAETTSPITSTIQYKDIGIILKVKPQINDSGLVSIELSQEVSSTGDNVVIGGQEFASINKTEAVTNLVAQDGETIIIGGLIREDVTKSKDGIPFLSKIPLIGNLFSSVTDNKTRTELLILITPHVVRNQQEAVNVTTDYLNKFKDGTKDEAVNEFLLERSEKKQNGQERQ
ncbi:MAG TPA: secretin N-terminal domain-containing protein [Thermodesulfovibrionales bacterium]|nr:secretin N-terminal domain-containing protein [Thermodesulfovibrionales bacterium]